MENGMRLDPEFRTLLPPLTDEEYSELEHSCITEGVRDALVLWKDILLDGYNRHAITQSHKLKYKTCSIDLPNRQAAKDWIIRNAIARRNLTPEALRYFRGKLYQAQKQRHGGD
jgi:hypothetical protein